MNIRDNKIRNSITNACTAICKISWICKIVPFEVLWFFYFSWWCICTMMYISSWWMNKLSFLVLLKTRPRSILPTIYFVRSNVMELLQTSGHQLELHSVERITPPGWTVYILYPTDRPDLQLDLNENLTGLFWSTTQLTHPRSFVIICPQLFEISCEISFLAPSFNGEESL